MATTTKDMWVANLIEPWRGDSSMSVTEFFESIDEAAEMGRLTAKDKVHLARLKLRGTARSFYSAQPEAFIQAEATCTNGHPQNDT